MKGKSTRLEDIVAPICFASDGRVASDSDDLRVLLTPCPGSYEKGLPMLSVRRVSIALAVVIGLVCVVLNFAVEPSHQPTGSDTKTIRSTPEGQSDIDLVTPEGPQLAARYHLRKRTSRFFKRATG